MNCKERLVIDMGYGIGDSVLLSNGKSNKIVKIFSYQTEVENGKFIDNDYIVDNLIAVYKHHNYTEEKIMKLKVGDIVEFKNYEDMTGDERMMIDKEFFPLYVKVKTINLNGYGRFFNIEEGYTFCTGSVSRVISDIDDIDIDSLKPGDEVLVKANVNEVFEDHVYVTSKIYKKSVVKILKRKEPEHFIVKEDYYGMYVGIANKLVSDKSQAKIYTSRNTANEDAADMHLNAWDVIPYDA